MYSFLIFQMVMLNQVVKSIISAYSLELYGKCTWIEIVQLEHFLILLIQFVTGPTLLHAKHKQTITKYLFLYE